MEPLRVFISYKKEEREFACKLESALALAGMSAWWDHLLSGGQRFDDIIQERIKAANCVIVVWSAMSVESDYVKDEATLALNERKLVPVRINACDLPLRFLNLHTFDFSAWNGNSNAPVFLELLKTIELYKSSSASVNTSPAAHFSSHQAPRIKPASKATGANDAGKAARSGAMPGPPVDKRTATDDPFLEPIPGIIIGKTSMEQLTEYVKNHNISCNLNPISHGTRRGNGELFLMRLSDTYSFDFKNAHRSERVLTCATIYRRRSLRNENHACKVRREIDQIKNIEDARNLAKLHGYAIISEETGRQAPRIKFWDNAMWANLFTQKSLPSHVASVRIRFETYSDSEISIYESPFVSMAIDLVPKSERARESLPH